MLRNVEIEHTRAAGLDVITDEEGQRVLDLANGKGMSKAMRFAYDEINKNTDESLTANNQELSRPRGESSVDDAKVDNRIEISKNASENLCELSQRTENCACFYHRNPRRQRQQLS